jgi:hypothetical protein
MATAVGDLHPPSDGVLMKPFALGAMLDEIRRVLRLYMGTNRPVSSDSPDIDEPV